MNTEIVSGELVWVIERWGARRKHAKCTPCMVIEKQGTMSYGITFSCRTVAPYDAAGRRLIVTHSNSVFRTKSEAERSLFLTKLQGTKRTNG